MAFMTYEQFKAAADAHTEERRNDRTVYRGRGILKTTEFDPAGTHETVKKLYSKTPKNKIQ